MSKFSLLLAALLPLQASADSILFGDYDKGSKLHKNSCTACHDSSTYTRKNRLVGSINGLEKRVALCSTMLKKNYSDDQQSDIVKFLNVDYYKFN